MKKNEIKKSQIWLVMTGFSCNNNCIMCSTRPKAKFYSDRPTEEVVSDLRRGRELGYEEVDLTGGEPTIRPDILDLVRFAKSMGYKKIGFNTNARMLSYENFCRKIIESGVNRITFTLNGHNKELADAISRTPGAFDQAIAGIKNTLNYPQVELSVNTVVLRMNYQYLKEIGEFINKLGIEVWHLLDLIPDGNAKGLYKILCVEAPEFFKSLNDLKSIASRFKTVMFFDFPLCFFPQEIMEDPRNIFITAKGRMEITKQVGYNPERFKELKMGSYEDIHKKRTEFCLRCKFSDTCAGIWKEYLDLYGEEEFRGLAQNNKCIDSAKEEEIHTYLQIGSTCNQKCLFCNRPPVDENVKFQDQQIDVIKKKIAELSKNRKIKRIIFTGGEPTLYPALLEFISFAKTYGFTTEIQTNGTILNGEKLKELKKARLDILNIALHSHKETVSNKLRGVNFGYKKIIENIRIAGKIGFEIHIIHVINAFNFNDLPEFIDFIHKMKLDKLYLNLSIVVPEGWAWKNKEVIPRIRDIKPYLQEAMKKCRDYGIKFDVSEIVPLCIMQGFENHAVSTLFKLSNMKIMDDYYTGQRILDFNNPSIGYAQKAPQCEKCTFDKICAGFYPRLKDIYGTADFVPRTDDPSLVLKKLNSQNGLLDEFKDKEVEVFHHKKTRSPDTLYINLDEKCNQNCVFCIVKGANKDKFGSMSREEAKKIIKNFIGGGGKTIVFTGGEPTLRDDLPELIEYTEGLDGSAVSIITNGTRLSDENYFEKILKADTRKKLGFCFSLHSHREAVSDLLTGSKGSFKKTFLGIKKAVKSGKIVSIYHVITSKNYNDLFNFVRFLNNNFPEIKEVTFAYPFPQGEALLNDWIYTKITSLRPYLIKTLNFLTEKKYKIKIAACGQFPLCAIPGFEEKVLQSLNDNEENVSGVVGEKAFHEFEMATDEWVKQYKAKDKRCRSCLLNHLCQGFWQKYIDLFGFNGINPVNENNFKGNRVLLSDKDGIDKLARKTKKHKLNLIIVKNNRSEEVINFINANKLLATVVHRNKVIYSKATL